MQSVMTRFTPGDGETFYFHAFKHYVPHFVQKSDRFHGLEIAVMTMEGFEHKNFTSKHAVQKRTNGKGNIAMQSMKILHLFFKCGYHNIEQELEKRIKSENKKNADITVTDADIDKLIEDHILVSV